MNNDQTFIPFPAIKMLLLVLQMLDEMEVMMVPITNPDGYYVSNTLEGIGGRVEGRSGHNELCPQS